MAEKFIEDIYRYANVISGLREIVERFRVDEDFCATELFQKQIPGLEHFLLSCIEDGYAESDILQEKLYSIKDLRDVTYIADMLEGTVIPIMESWIQSWVSVGEQMDTRYRIESTASGFLTIKDEQADRYLHSNNDPMDEARVQIAKQFDYSKEVYVVWGCGLGYHVYQLYVISEGTVPITVYESNPNLIRYALRYGALSWIPKENLRIMPGYSAEEFIKNIQETDGVFLLRSYVNAMQNEVQKAALLKYLSDGEIKGNKKTIANLPEIQGGGNEILGYANIISRLRKAVSLIRVMEDQTASDLLKNSWSAMENVSHICRQEGYLEGEELEASLSTIEGMQDPILLGDILENEIIPIMERWLQSKAKAAADKMLDERYRLEHADNGFFTIKDVVSNIYLHSKLDPMDESRKLLEKQYNGACQRYIVWGCGLGYHIYQLYCISEGRIPIVVYDTNPDLVQYAFEFGVLSWVPQEVLEIKHVKSAEEFLDAQSDGDGVIYLNAYIRANDDKEQRNLLNKRYSRFIFRYDATHNLKLNFYRNKSLKLPYASEIDHTKLNKEMVVIGAGPSLDHFMDTLREWQGKKTLIAAGTVWKKLLNAGIHPDFVVIMDPYEIVFQQVEGITDTSATLLITTQAYWRVGKYYRGKKYLIPTPVPVDGLEDCWEKEGVTPWFAGGSVTVNELEFTVRMFADKVYLVGVDLSMPGGLTHASDTRYRQKVEDLSGLIPQEDVNGNIVYTNSILAESKDWFELIMGETEGIEFINMSDVGVKLKGTVPYTGRPDRT